MEKDLKERIRMYMRIKGITAYQISKKNGIPQPTVLKQINGDTQLSARVLMAFISIVPDCSMEWLMRGEGEMEVEEKAGNECHTESNVIAGDNNMTIINKLLEQNAELLRLLKR